MLSTPSTILCDFYKLSHRECYPKNTEIVYSTWTPRTSRIEGVNKVVAFGFQGFIKKYLMDYFAENFFSESLEKILYDYKRIVKQSLGIENPETSHIEALHKLGYMPLEIRAVKEGTLVPVRVPMLTVRNTKPEFFWLTNYLETLFSCSLWQPITSATIALEYKKILTQYALETGDVNAVPFQGHDFSMRGMSSLESAEASGAGHLTSFVGTDTIPAIDYIERFYLGNVEKELIGTSIPATEHSVMCAYGQENEYDLFKRLITEIYPSGLFSVVSDTWDFWQVVGEYLPRLKSEIMQREGKVVIRPDSGDPQTILCGSANVINLSEKEHCFNLEDCKRYMEEILVDEVSDHTPHGEHGESEVEGIFKYEDKYYKITVGIFWNRYDKQYYFIDSHEIEKCEEVELSLDQKGLIECLWDIFGGTVNDKGYKELDSHIGAIYGDAITLDRCRAICERLKQKGFASTNVVYGIGSYTYQYNTRDTFGFAMKATYVMVDGEERKIFKDPKTDSGVKKSQRGLVVITEDEGSLKFIDDLNQKQYDELEDQNVMKTIFCNGFLTDNLSISDIRNTISQSI